MILKTRWIVHAISSALFGRLFARKSKNNRRLTTDEKLRAYDRVIADMETKARIAGYTAYLEEGKEIY